MEGKKKERKLEKSVRRENACHDTRIKERKKRAHCSKGRSPMGPIVEPTVLRWLTKRPKSGKRQIHKTHDFVEDGPRRAWGKKTRATLVISFR